MALRILFLAGWLLVPVGVYAWHMGPGQDRQQLDAADALIRQADREVAAGDHAAALDTYAAALAALPEGQTATARTLKLERAKAQMLAKQLPEANADLKALVDDLAGDPKADPKQLAAAREAFANSQYYVGWLMRLEGQVAENWEPELEASRQVYKLLAEQAEAAGDAAAAKRHTDSLEAAVRLARMDLNELTGLPLPCQCQGCKACNKAGKRPGKKPGKTGEKQEKQDVRKSGMGPPHDPSGH